MITRLSCRLGIAALVVTLTLLSGNTAADAASPTCNFDPATHLLVAKWPPDTSGGFTIQRAGEEIQVVGSAFGKTERISCGGGTPTVTTTDQIELLTGNSGSFDIDLHNGPFAPGATAEPTGSSEIEFVIKGGGGEDVSVNGTAGADHFRYMSAEGVSGLNWNPEGGDNDVDVIVPKRKTHLALGIDSEEGSDQIEVTGTSPVRLVSASGGPGNDTLLARSTAIETFLYGDGGSDQIEVTGTSPVRLVSASGGSGDDTLRAKPAGDTVLYGNSGSDHLVGGPQDDFLVPGRGRDTIESRGGDDLLYLGDHSRDIARCGKGHDHTINADRFDVLSSCEKKEKEFIVEA